MISSLKSGIVWAAFWLAAATMPAWAQCRQALVLALDVSGSVDAQEYQLQMQGLASALNDPDVVAAILTLPDTPVQISVFEWSSPTYQRIIVPWARLITPENIASVANVLSTQRRTDLPPTTGLGTAMQFGKSLLDQRPACWRKTLDISGDGKNNSGPRARDIRSQLGQIEVNALVIGVDAPSRLSIEELEVGELTAYFHSEVLHGPAPFIEVALGFEDYARAMRRKLLRELEIPTLSNLGQ